MAVSMAERTNGDHRSGGGGEFLLVGGGLAALLAGALWLANQSKVTPPPGPCNPDPCAPGQTCVPSADGTTYTCQGVACLDGMPAGSLIQDPSLTISIVDPAGTRRGFTDIKYVNACGYNLARLVQISNPRREAIPLGAVIDTYGICPPQSTEESPPIGL